MSRDQELADIRWACSIIGGGLGCEGFNIHGEPMYSVPEKGSILLLAMAGLRVADVLKARESLRSEMKLADYSKLIIEDIRKRLPQIDHGPRGDIEFLLSTLDRLTAQNQDEGK